MSFLNSLLKSFVRSAVNQVGRDAGRVISNTTMRGRHATPHTYIPREQAIPGRKEEGGEQGPINKHAQELNIAPIQAGEPSLRLTDIERGLLIQNGAHLLEGYDKSLADKGFLAQARVLTEDETYAYAMTLVANADGVVSPEENQTAVDLSAVMVPDSAGLESGQHILQQVATYLHQDLSNNIHPMVVLRQNLDLKPIDIQLNTLRLMAKIILRDWKLEQGELNWFFEVMGYIGRRPEEL